MEFRKAIVVDPDQLFGAALAALLSREGADVAVHATAAAAMEAAGHGEDADLVLIDPYSGRHPAPAEVLRQVRDGLPRARILVLTGDQSDAALRTSLSVGADAHLSKTGSPDMLRHALRLVSLGQALYPAEAAALLDEPAALPTDEHSAELSAREVQILSCLLGGLSNKAIARRLSITESTVKMHFKNLMRKIGAANRTQAAVWALAHGIRPTLA